MTDNFEFKLLGGEDKPFKGYISSTDKTKVNERAMIRGSMNVYKKRSGNIANRPGLKRRGVADTTDAGTTSSYDWKSLLGRSLPIRVNNGKLQVESDIVTNGSPLWYDLLIHSTLVNPATGFTRLNFDRWWDDDEKQDLLLIVRGDSSIFDWSGGIAKVASVGSEDGTVTGATIGAAGAGYATGDILTIASPTPGGRSATILVYLATAGAVSTIQILDRGTGFANATLATTTDGSGTGCTINVFQETSYTITKDGTETWAESGFTNLLVARKNLIINGAEYLAYCGGSDTTTLTGILTNTLSIPIGSVAIQPVFENVLTGPPTDFKVDFLRVLKNQNFIGSESSKVIYISADINSDFGTKGFTDFSNAGSYVQGDPDLAIIDSPPIGMIPRKDSMYVSAGTSDWYEITPNFAPPVSFTGSEGVSRFIITKVEKFAGTGLSAALSHEFIDIVGNNIIYLAQDHQLRTIGTFSNVEGLKFPSLSDDVYEELQEEDFTGGHIKSIEDIIYLTAPIAGRHWMFRHKDGVDSSNNLTSEKEWYPPHVSGLSRIAEIDGVAYGHSNANPQIYQIWDTNQFYDDSPTDEQIAYTSALRMAYRNHGRKQGLIDFDKIYIEGYMREGTELLGNVYYDYQGASGIQNIIINSNEDGTRFFIGNQAPSLGDSSLGSNPLGIPMIPESSEQDFVPKFRSICGVKKMNCFEYSLEFYTTEVDARWEISCLGTTADLTRSQQAGFIQK